MNLFRRRGTEERVERPATPSRTCPQCGAGADKATEASPLGPPELRQLVCNECGFEYPKAGGTR